MMNSSTPSTTEVLAIENDRCSSVPGMEMSTYCPGWKRRPASGSSFSRTSEMSCVRPVIDSTVVPAVTTGRPDRIMSSS